MPEDKETIITTDMKINVRQDFQSLGRGAIELYGCLFFVLCLLGLGIYAVLPYKYICAIQCGVAVKDIFIEKKPADCDFMTAPIGNKGCSYERQVSTVRWAKSDAGVQLRSYDEGETWVTLNQIEVQGPDGARYEFPANTSLEEIYKAMASKFPNQQSSGDPWRIVAIKPVVKSPVVKSVSIYWIKKQED
jgi:hypothetical protein